MAIVEDHRQGTRVKLGAALKPSWPGSSEELQTLVSQVEQQIFEKAKGLADYDKRAEKRIAKIPVAVARSSNSPPPTDNRVSRTQPPVVEPTPTPTAPPPVLAPTVTPAPAPPPTQAPSTASQAREENYTAEVLAAAKAHASFIDAFRKRFPTPAAVQATDPRVVAKLQELVGDVHRFDALVSGHGPPVNSVVECKKLCASFVSIQTVCEKLIQRVTAATATAATPTSQAAAPPPATSSLSSSPSGSSSSTHGSEASRQAHTPAVLPSKRRHDDTASGPSSGAPDVPQEAPEAPMNAQAAAAVASALASPDKILREGAALARRRLQFTTGDTVDELSEDLRLGLLALARSDKSGKGGDGVKPSVALGRAPPLSSGSSGVSSVSAADRAKAQLIAAHFDLFSPGASEVPARGGEEKAMDAVSNDSSNQSAASMYLQTVKAAVQGYVSDLRVLASPRSGSGLSSSSKEVQRLEATLHSAVSGSGHDDNDFVVFLDLAELVGRASSRPNSHANATSAALSSSSSWWPRAVAVLTSQEASAWRVKHSTTRSSRQGLEWPLDASNDHRCRALASAATAAISMHHQMKVENFHSRKDGDGGRDGATATVALLRLLHRLSAVAAPSEPNTGPEETIRLAQLACLWLPST